jgi:hypothetical protein
MSSKQPEQASPILDLVAPLKPTFPDPLPLDETQGLIAALVDRIQGIEQEKNEAVAKANAKLVKLEVARVKADAERAKAEVERAQNDVLLQKERAAVVDMGTVLLRQVNVLKLSWEKAHRELEGNVKALIATRPSASVRKDGKLRGYALAVKRDSSGGALIRVLPCFRENVEEKLALVEKDGFERVAYNGLRDYFNQSANPSDFMDNVSSDGSRYLNEALGIKSSRVDFTLASEQIVVPPSHDSAVTVDAVIPVLKRIHYETSECMMAPRAMSTLATCNTSCLFIQHVCRSIGKRLRETPAPNKNSKRKRCQEEEEKKPAIEENKKIKTK